MSFVSVKIKTMFIVRRFFNYFLSTLEIVIVYYNNKILSGND
jgi:hypothetical protein